ncbi:MAG: hypothetical protein NT040_19330 [Bacteroidetes bacterium]|nr:hypothetical protein [Bacteroidota bacterium]
MIHLSEKQQLENEIKQILDTLEAEKQKLGYYEDKDEQLRYLPSGLFLKLRDYQRGLDYNQWVAETFMDDCPPPGFLFEWSVFLFMSGKIKEAEYKLVETFISNTYVFDKFFDRQIVPIDKVEYLEFEHVAFVDNFKYSFKQEELAPFVNWFTVFEQSDRFSSVAKRFVKSQVQLQIEDDPERIFYLERVDWQILNEYGQYISNDLPPAE